VGVCDSAKLDAFDNVEATAHDTSTVNMYGGSEVYAFDRVDVVACGFSIVRVKSDTVNVVRKNHFGAVCGLHNKVAQKTMIVYAALRDKRIAILKINKGDTFETIEPYKLFKTARARVVAIRGINKKNKFLEGRTTHGSGEVYRVGTTVGEKDGVTFYLSKKEALEQIS